MTDALILDGVTCRYDTVDVLENVSLRLAPGTLAALIGPSGGGKTTLLKMLLGLVPVRQGQAQVFGDKVVCGRPPRHIGYVPQLETVDWDFPVTVEEVVSMGLAGRRLGPRLSRSERQAVQDMLGRLGLEALRGRHLKALSGGQQQRVFLARALLPRPRLLLLDEPLSGVDVKTRRDVLGCLQDLQRDGLTILLTSHELSAVAAHVPWCICINRTKVADGPSHTVLSAPVLSETFGVPLQVHWQDDALLVGEAQR